MVSSTHRTSSSLDLFQIRTRALARRTILGLVIAVMALPGFAAETPVLRLAADSWPPFTDHPEGQHVAIDLVQTALDRAGITSITTITDWKEVENGIRRATFDGSPAMWHTERRERDLLFSDPYLENRLVLVGRKGSDVSATRMSDLAGKRVAAVGHYGYGKAVDSAAGVIFVNGRNDQEDLTKLLAGEVDYMLVDELVVRYLLTNQYEEAAARLEIGRKPLARRSLHFALRRDLANAEKIISAFNTEIRRMWTDGSYGRILQVGWIRVDVDGDGLDELVALGDAVGRTPPGSVYDVFGETPEDLQPEKERIFVQGSIFEGWNAIPEQYKQQTTEQGDVGLKQGVTLFTLQF